MKILISNFHKQGFGQISYVQFLGKLLTERGHEVSVATPKDSWLAERAVEMGLRVEDGFNFSPGFRPIHIFSDLLEARRVIRKIDPDIIHANGSQDHWVMAAARRLFGGRAAVVRTKHNSFPMKTHAANRLLARRLTDRWIVVSEAVRRDLLDGPLFPARRDGAEPTVDTIHNGLDIEKYQPQDARLSGQGRVEFGLSPDDFVVGTLGRITRAKGLNYLIDAAAPLIRRPGANLRLMLVGWGEEMDNLRRQAEGLGVSEDVKFAGLHDDVQRMIAMFDIGVQASIDCESSSFALKEIMAMGVPCVCTDFAGNAEIVGHDENGLVVPPADAEALRDAIERLWLDDELRTKFASTARERIRTHFSPETCVEATLETYRKAMGKPATAGGQARITGGQAG